MPDARVAGVRRRLAVYGLATVAAVAITPGGIAAAAPPDEGAIREAGSARVAPDSYIVVLKESAVRAQGTDTAARSLSSKFGGTLRHTYRKAINGFAVRGMTEAQARKLAADPAVAYVQKDGIVKASSTQTGAPWGLDRIDQRNLPLDGRYNYMLTASTVHAYIIDTGIKFGHNEFGSRVSDGYNATASTGYPNDCNGHGTHVAGIIGGSTYGVAKDVQLVPVRVLDCNGAGSTSDLIAGIDWVTANAVKPAVASLSLGGGADATVDAAVQRSIASGVTYGVAAGNGDDAGNPLDACSQSPARVPEAITVGATDRNDQRASFSNYGTCLDIFAPGVDIPSAWHTSYTDTATKSGTSMAAAYVVGAAAVVLRYNGNYRPDQVYDALFSNATANIVGNPGTGSRNRLLYVDNSTVPRLASKPVTVYNPSARRLEVLAVASGSLLERFWSPNTGWSAWIDLGGNLNPAGVPAVIYNPRFGSIEVYARTTDNQLVEKFWLNGWSDWIRLNSGITSDPAAIYNPKRGTSDIYARNSSGRLEETHFYTSWSPWTWVPLGGDGTPAVIYDARVGVIEVYARGTDNHLYETYFYGGSPYYNGWSAPIDLGGNITGTPTVLYDPRVGVIEVYARGNNGHLVETYFYNGWSDWVDLGGDLIGDPSVIYNPRNGTIEAYARTRTGLAETYFYNGWSGWIDIGGNLTNDPAAIYNPLSANPNIFVNSDGVLFEKYWGAAGGWSDWLNLGQ